MNAQIMPSLVGADDNGWHKDETWEMDVAGSGAYGDDAVGTAYEARYWKAGADGQFLVVDEAYFVETAETTNQLEVRNSFVVTGVHRFTVCTDLDDVGGTEITSDLEYDHEVDVLFHDDIAKAEAICRRFAVADMRFTLTWGQ